VASAAERPSETLYPLGDAAPGCEQAVVGVSPLGPGGECLAVTGTTGPQPIDARATTDLTPGLGIINLTGSAMELTRDSTQRYDHPCWESTGPRDPACLETSAPRHSGRGGTWFQPPQFSKTPQRFPFPGWAQGPFLGFRCAYATPPS
jgi:formylglycine-generating enzyme required for sulfatase activity